MRKIVSLMSLCTLVVVTGCTSALQAGEPTSTPVPDFAQTSEGVLTVNVFVEDPCLMPSPKGEAVESSEGSYRHLRVFTRVLLSGDDFEATEAPSFSLTNQSQNPTTVFVKDSLAFGFARSREDFGFERTISLAPIAWLTIRDGDRTLGLHKRKLLPGEQATVYVRALVPGGLHEAVFDQLGDDPVQVEAWETDLRAAITELMGKSLETSIVVRAECDV